MASSGKREPSDDTVEQVVDAAEGLAAERSDEAVTEVRPSAALPIPPLLTDEADAVARVVEGASGDGDETVRIAETFGAMGTAPDPEPDYDAVLPEVPGEREAASAEAVEAAAETPAGATPPVEGRSATGRDRLADAANSAREKAADRAGLARERAAEHAGAAREKATEHASAAREKLSEGAGEAKERLAETAADAKVRGAKMRKRFVEVAADARESASSAASEARGRMANADVNEFAHSTTRLIDQARPFFLAGFAVVFAALGFLEGDSGTAELFVAGAIIFVLGAGFSGEINAFLAERLKRSAADARSAAPDDRTPGGGRPRDGL